MIVTNTNLTECASTYIYVPLRDLPQPEAEKQTRKVTAPSPVSSTKKFNKNNSSNDHSDQHIDVET